MFLQLVRRVRGRWARRGDIRAVASSRFFSRQWYLNRYPDVAESGMDPALHYVLHGGAERRSPGPDFDAHWYLMRNPDVAASGVNPLLHYIEQTGEGRKRQYADPYGQWIRDYDSLDDTDREAIRAHIATLVSQPLISIVVPVYNTEEKYLREMIESVRGQLYVRWELCLADDASSVPHSHSLPTTSPASFLRSTTTPTLQRNFAPPASKCSIAASRPR